MANTSFAPGNHAHAGTRDFAEEPPPPPPMLKARSPAAEARPTDIGVPPYFPPKEAKDVDAAAEEEARAEAVDEASLVVPTCCSVGARVPPTPPPPSVDSVGRSASASGGERLDDGSDARGSILSLRVL